MTPRQYLPRGHRAVRLAATLAIITGIFAGLFAIGVMIGLGLLVLHGGAK